MLVTDHALLRIRQRSRLSADQIVSLIEHGAFVSLGTSEQYEYLLFYSPLDRRTKIAIVSANRTTLVSIWENDFVRPASISKITKARVLEVKKLWKRYVFEKIVVKQPRNVLITLYGIYRNKRIFTHEFGCHTTHGLRLSDVIGVVRDILATLLDAAECNRALYEDTVIFEIALRCQSTQRLVCHRMSKDEWSKKIQAAT